MTGRARAKAHKAAARQAVRADRWSYEAEREGNRDAIRATAALGGARVTAFFQTSERRAARVLRNFLRAL